MKYKRLFVTATAVALVGVSSPAIAATISNLNGQSCGDGVGVWHFVNNQTGGAGPGLLDATFSDGTFYNDVPADKVNASNQHWTVEAGGDLISASTNLPGKLVLSDFTCEDSKKK